MTKIDNIDAINDLDKVVDLSKSYEERYDIAGKSYLNFIQNKNSHIPFNYHEDIGTWFIPTKLYTYPNMVKLIESIYPDKVFEYGLDIGCGTTTFFEDFKKVDKHMIIDISQTLVDYMISKGFTAKKMNIEKLDFENNTFDLIIASDVLEHCLSFDNAYNEIKRVLKKDGLLCVDVPWNQDVSTFSAKDFTHLRTFNENNIQTYFKDFNIVRTHLVNEGAKYGWIDCMNIVMKCKDTYNY